MTVQYIADHVELAKNRLVSQYQNAPNVIALVKALAARVQALEDAIDTVAHGRMLVDSSAKGAQLDAIGAQVGIARNGLDDPTYYVMIRGKIATNTSKATLGDIERIAKTLFQASAVYATTPNTPGHDRVRAYAELSLAVGDPKAGEVLTDRIVRLIRAAMPAGVVLVSLSFFDTKYAFCCDGPQPWAMAFSDIDGQGGGKLARLILSNPLA